MSSVFARYHQPTGLEFWDNAVQIEIEIYHIIRNFPKSARFTHSIPLFQAAQRMNDFIAEANSIYCTNQHETEIRRDIIQKAIGCNEAIIQRLRRCAMELEGIDVNKLDKVGELLIKESTLLRNWKQSTKCAR